MNVFLHDNLKALGVIDIQSIFNLFETTCSLFDKQLKPILVLFDLVNSTPVLLSLCKVFSISRGIK